MLGGVPFELPESKRALVTEGIREKVPASANIPANVPHATAAYILLSGLYVSPKFKGKRVDEIIFEFGADEKLTIPIVAWKTIRKTWAFDDNIQEPDSEGNPKLVNVYTEKQNRGQPASAFFDMLIVDFGDHRRAASLTNITIRDISRQTVNNVAPALVISGITIKRE
jgi:hypothetical protein